MRNPQNLPFKNECDAGSFMEARSDFVSTCVTRTLKAYGGTKKARLQARSLMGRAIAPAQALYSNLALLTYCSERLITGLSQIIPQSDDVNLRLTVLGEGRSLQTYDSVSINFKEQRDEAYLKLKSEEKNFVAFPMLRCEAEGVKSITAALMWNEDLLEPRSIQKSGRRRVGTGALKSLKLENTKLDIAKAIVTILDPFGTDYVDASRKKGDWKFSIREDGGEHLLFNAFALHACVRLDHIAFACGSGRVLLKSVLREVRARA